MSTENLHFFKNFLKSFVFVCFTKGKDEEKAGFPAGEVSAQDDAAFFHGEGASFVAVFLHDASRGDAGGEDYGDALLAEGKDFFSAEGRYVAAAQAVYDDTFDACFSCAFDDFSIHTGPCGDEPDVWFDGFRMKSCMGHRSSSINDFLRVLC